MAQGTSAFGNFTVQLFSNYNTVWAVGITISLLLINRSYYMHVPIVKVTFLQGT